MTLIEKIIWVIGVLRRTVVGLNRCQPLPAPYIIQTITQQETISHWLLFIVQPCYLHNTHTSSQPITWRVYQRLLYLLTNQIAHQGFWIFNRLRLWLDSEDGFRTGCRNVSRKQSFSGLQSPRSSFSRCLILLGSNHFLISNLFIVQQLFFVMD